MHGFDKWGRWQLLTQVFLICFGVVQGLVEVLYLLVQALGLQVLLKP